MAAPPSALMTKSLRLSFCARSLTKTIFLPSGENAGERVEARRVRQLHDAGSVGAHLVDVEVALLRAVGVEDDPLAVGRPVRVLAVVGRVRQLRLAAAVAVHHPDLARRPVRRLDREGDPVGARPGRIALVLRRARQPALARSRRSRPSRCRVAVAVGLERDSRAVARPGRVDVGAAREGDLSLAGRVGRDHVDVGVAPRRTCCRRSAFRSATTRRRRRCRSRSCSPGGRRPVPSASRARGRCAGR